MPGTAPGPQHRGTIHISPTMEYIERAYDDAKYGRPSAHPIIEATIPSVLDDTVAPRGQYVMSMFTQYFPYKLAPGLSLEDEKEQFADRCFDTHDAVRAELQALGHRRQVLSPVDLEHRFGLTGGNIMQGAMSLSSLSFMRPVPGYADYRTPVAGSICAGRRRIRGGGDGRVRLQRGPRDRARPASVGQAPLGGRRGSRRSLQGARRVGSRRGLSAP